MTDYGFANGDISKGLFNPAKVLGVMTAGANQAHKAWNVVKPSSLAASLGGKTASSGLKANANAIKAGGNPQTGVRRAQAGVAAMDASKKLKPYDKKIAVGVGAGGVGAVGAGAYGYKKSQKPF